VSKCCVCQKGPEEGVSLYRINEKGVPGIWACMKHLKQTGAPVDPELDELVRVLEGKTP